jgi:hypothetical protein
MMVEKSPIDLLPEILMKKANRMTPTLIAGRSQPDGGRSRPRRR